LFWRPTLGFEFVALRRYSPEMPWREFLPVLVGAVTLAAVGAAAFWLCTYAITFL